MSVNDDVMGIFYEKTSVQRLNIREFFIQKRENFLQSENLMIILKPISAKISVWHCYPKTEIGKGNKTYSV